MGAHLSFKCKNTIASIPEVNETKINFQKATSFLCFKKSTSKWKVTLASKVTLLATVMTTDKHLLACLLFPFQWKTKHQRSLDILFYLFTELLFSRAGAIARILKKARLIIGQITKLKNKHSSVTNLMNNSNLYLDNICMFMNLIKHYFVWLT